MVTRDKKWVTYDNIVQKQLWSKRGEEAQTVAKPGLTSRKVLLRIWWDWKRIIYYELLLYKAHFWWNGYVNKQNCRIWSEANPQVYVETPLHPEKLTFWCALWAGGILLQKR
ncbi:histone-lysine N-methyltransferase SETMAR [Trichonephila clavipes]|nr:histone-lysine N-methyltransferase SETMAR [Trichonephila clavipes]